MKKVILLLWLVLPLWVNAAVSYTPEPGVPRALAERRAKNISAVHYDLKVTVPDDLTAAVTGLCRMSFTLAAKEDLPVDYSAEAEGTAVRALINGKECELQVVAEHLVLPAKMLKKGRNTVELPFVCNNKTLNRHADYLYTLFVPANARSVFPCFDQPDLKATFALEADVPDGWETLCSAGSKPIPTYLFSFVAGKFIRYTAERDGREMVCLYRETDPKKTAQIPGIFDMAALSIRWMEAYTGIPYPFDYYRMVILPSYQFGGMEHPGAIQFNDRTLLLPENPTPAEQLKRFNLIAHETAHMWFGDLVTMRWFDDVWTKEVFAGFLADKICREQFPELNHELNFLYQHYPACYSTDRTEGTHPIQQTLENLNEAGLLYGNIIYHKSPVVMKMIEEKMGEEALQKALRDYVKEYAYANATWDDLIALMDKVAPSAGIVDLDRMWVKEATRLPYTDITDLPDVNKILSQYAGNSHDNEMARMRFVLDYYENFRRGKIGTEEAYRVMLRMLREETNTLIATTLANYLTCTHDLRFKEWGYSAQDAFIYELVQTHPLAEIRLQLKRYIYKNAVNPVILSTVERIWTNMSDDALSARDYTEIAYHLAVMNPQRWESILETQRRRMKTKDELREFNYISQGCTPAAATRRDIFFALLKPENRINEPWACSLLALLCDKIREENACYYLLPALNNLEYIQKTSDIFFPGNFLHSLLSARYSFAAYRTVSGWMEEHPEVPEPLIRKVKENLKQ